MARRSDGLAAAGARIRPGDHVAIFGRTETGKTTLARSIIEPFPRGLVLDPKRRFALRGWEPLEGTISVVRGWPTGWPRVVARPGLIENATDWLNTCCRRAYQVESCVVAIDELAGIANASAPPVWLDVLQTRGRELGITTVICSQRPKRIPLSVLSEASHVFVFGLNTPADRDYVADTIGGYWSPSSLHGFLYWRPDMAEPIECAPLELA